MESPPTYPTHSFRQLILATLIHTSEPDGPENFCPMELHGTWVYAQSSTYGSPCMRCGGNFLEINEPA